MRPFLLLALVLVLAASVVNAQVTFQDGTFLDADWTMTVLINNHPNGGVNAHEATGGNPDDHRSITNNACQGNNPCRIFTIGMRSGAVYDPSTEGSILTISYSEDLKCASVDGCVGGGQTANLAILQGGTIYLSATTAPTGVANNWSPVSYTGLVATDFGELDLSVAPVINVGSNPDFGAMASPMQFGYARGNSLSSARTGRIDNWSVSVFGSTSSTEKLDWGRVKSLFR